MDELSTSIAAKKERLDAMRPVSREALLAFQKYYDVDLTYTSNAIEGNTLTLRETAEVIEHGITVGGKPLRDHLEAVACVDAATPGSYAFIEIPLPPKPRRTAAL